MKGHVALITQKLLVRILLAPTQVAGTHPAGLARVIFAIFAGGPALPWTQEPESAQAGLATHRRTRSPHPTLNMGDIGGIIRTHFASGFQPQGSPRLAAQS